MSLPLDVILTACKKNTINSDFCSFSHLCSIKDRRRGHCFARMPIMCGITITITISLCSLFCAGKQGDIQPTENCELSFFFTRIFFSFLPSLLMFCLNVNTTLSQILLLFAWFLNLPGTEATTIGLEGFRIRKGLSRP